MRTNQALAGGSRIQSALESWIGCLGLSFGRWILDKYVSGVTGVDLIVVGWTVPWPMVNSKDGVWIRASQAIGKK